MQQVLISESPKLVIFPFRKSIIKPRGGRPCPSADLVRYGHSCYSELLKNVIRYFIKKEPYLDNIFYEEIPGDPELKMIGAVSPISCLKIPFHLNISIELY